MPETKVSRRPALTAKEKQFVDAYMSNGGDGAAAARTAGYSPRTAKQHAHELLKKPKVAQAIRRRQKSAGDKAQVDAERVIAEFAKIGMATLKDATAWDATSVTPIPSDEIPDEVAAAIASVEQTATGVKVKMHDKLSALANLARCLGIYDDQVTVKTDVLDRLRARMEAAGGA